MNAQEAWDIAYNQLELQFDKASFDTWLRGATFLDLDGDTFVIGVRNGYAKDMLQHRLYRNVRRVVCDVYGQPVELQFEVHKPVPQTKDASNEMPLFRLLAQQDDTTIPFNERLGRSTQQTLPENELNPRFTFERFIVNGSNRITYEAARAVAANPARSYNPLLIYGGVGLGKTHLLQAIGQVYQSKGLHTIYIPSEVFTNDLVSAIRNKTTAMFRDKYRSADILLVDDIQFIAGKDSTQEEFFHTFNALYTFNKQIVLASDRHPHELNKLDDRLRSRFGGGLVTDVQPLEYESRLALVQMWATERNLNLEHEVLEMIAYRTESNVRELEGAFNSVVAQAKHARGTLTLSSATSQLERFDQPRHHVFGQKMIAIEDIIEQTAIYFNLSVSDLIGKKRAGRINMARQIAMHIARDLTDASLPQIGGKFGGRSHTTVLHGCNKIAEELEFDSGLRNHIEQICHKLTGK